MPNYQPTNAASSGVRIDKKQLKALMRRSDKAGLSYLLKWSIALLLTGLPIAFTLGTIWVWPAMLIYGVVLTVPSYAISHECAHGTAFRTRWLNELVFWITSLVYMEEPLHRRFTHTNHHTYTWHTGKDSQMPFDTPMGFGGWLLEISGISLLRFHTEVLLRLLTGRYSAIMREVTPEDQFPAMTRNAWIFAFVYAAMGFAIYLGDTEWLWFLVIPRLLGAPIMLLFTLLNAVAPLQNKSFPLTAE